MTILCLLLPMGANKMIHSTTFIVVKVKAVKKCNIGSAFDPTVAMAAPKAL